MRNLQSVIPSTGRNIVRAFAVAALLSSASLSPEYANAQEATAFLEALRAKIETRGGSVEYGNLNDLGSGDLEAENVKIHDKETGNEIRIEKLTLNGTQTDGSNRFVAKALDAQNFTLERQKGANNSLIKIERISALDFALEPRSENLLPWWPFDMERGEISGLTLEHKATASLTWEIPQIVVENLVAGEGEDFSLESLAIAASTGSTIEKEANGSRFSIGDMDLKQMEVRGHGYKLAEVSIGPLKIESSDDEGFVVNFEGMKAFNMFTPDFVNGTAPWFPEGETKVEIGGALMAISGTPVMTFDGGNSLITYGEDGVSQKASYEMKNIFFNLNDMALTPEMEKSIRPLKNMGYDDLTLQLSGRMDWNVETGELSISQIRYGADKMAALDLSVKLSGVDAQVVGRFQKISSRMNRTSDKSTQEALAFQLLAELSGLSFDEMTIALDDASLTRRIMEMQAQQSGQKAEDLAAGVPFMAGAMLGQFNVPEFASQVSAALSTYLQLSLNDGGRLSISAKPDEPISFAELSGIIAGAQAGNVPPADIIDRLNLSVQAD